MSRRILLCIAISSLAACGGGGGGSGVAQLDTALLPAGSVNAGSARVELPAQQTYLELTEDAPGMVILEGIGMVAVNAGETVSPEETRFYLYGTRDGATDRIVMSNTIDTFVDDDGTDEGGQLAYRGGAFNIRNGGDVSSFVYSDSFFVNNPDTSGGAIIGVSASADDMPRSGTTTYRGTGLLSFNTASLNQSSESLVQLSVDFADSRVDTTITPDVSSLPTMRVTNMQIEGNSFSGGSVGLFNGALNTTNQVTGGLPQGDAAGLFFGPIESADNLGNFDGPAEAGGRVLLTGQTGVVSARFQASLD